MKFSKFFIASLKRTAQNVYPLVRRKNKLKEEIEEKHQELEDIQLQLDQFEAPIAQATGGFTTEDLVTRKVVETGKTDKDGKPVKVTQYTLTYPETIIPPVPEEMVGEVLENAVEEDFDKMSDDLPFAVNNGDNVINN